MLRVTPIYGSTGHHPKSKSLSLPPSCTLIEYGGVRILVNVGLDESMSTNTATATSAANATDASVFYHELPAADVILLTDSSLQSIGGLPFYYGQDALQTQTALKHKQKKQHKQKKITKTNSNNDDENNLKHEDKHMQIFATYPTIKMGQMNLYDHHANISLDGGNPGYTLSDIDSLFASSTYYTSTQSQSQTSQSKLSSANNNNSSKTITTSEQTNIQESQNKNDTSSSSKTNNNNPTSISIQTLKYAQTVIIYNPQNPSQPILSITPHKAGHLIGASYYILKRFIDETEVVVAPIYHHAKEKHLDSSTLFTYGTACDVLITNCGGPSGLLGQLYSPLNDNNYNDNTNPNRMMMMRNKKNKAILNKPSVGRDEGELVETILSTLRRGGNVLLPVDASGRVLELIYLLNQHWEKHRLSSAYNLCWVGSMVHNTIEFVKSQLEWMNENLGSQFDCGRGHPFNLKHVDLFNSVAELERDLPGLFGGANGGGGVGADDDKVESMGVDGKSNPTIVLASGATLDNGPARDLFLKWCENSDNAIILTDSRRCVLRGDVRVEQSLKASSVAAATAASVSMIGDGGGVDGTGTTRTTNNTSIQKQQLSDNTGVNDNLTSTTTTDVVPVPETPPNIIQEDEEVAGTTSITIGSSISTSSRSEFSTAAQLLLKWCEAKVERKEMEDVVDCDALVPKRSVLAGMELQLFLEKEEEMRLKEKAEEERLAMLREVEIAKGRLRLTETDDTGGGAGGSGSAGKSGSGNKSSDYASSSTLSHTHSSSTGQDVVSTRPKKKSRFDANLFLKFSKPCHMTFEVREEAVGIGQPDAIAKYGIGESIGYSGEVLEDDYGIAVKPESFVDIVPGVDSSKYAGGSGRIGDDVLKRGLGFGSDGRPLLATSKLSSIDGKELGEHGLNQNSEQEELALEAADLSEGNGIIRGRNNRPPVKVSAEPRRLEVLAEIAFIPLEGRVDAISARNSIKALQPRQVVILGGGEPTSQTVEMNTSVVGKTRKSPPIVGEAALLADAVRSLALGERGSIFAPTDRETIELSVGHAAYSIRLIDTPYMTREEKEAMMMDSVENIPSVEPYEAKVGDCTVSLMDCVATGQRVAADGSIVLAPRRVPGSNEQSTVMLSGGDVLLNSLMQDINAQGMKADYSAHVGYTQLIVNSKVVVRKCQTSGEINVEGPLCEDFFLVRSIVCSQYVTL